MSEQLLKVHNLHSYYGKSHIIQGISMQVARGECVIILGHNGMGKTTFLRSILGVKSIRRHGSILFNGEELINMRTYKIAQRGIGYVPQGRHLFPSLSVDEHLHFVYRSPKRNKNHIWTPEKVYELFPELKNRKEIGGTKLSGGEQQMLAIGRALVTNPTLLLMDEPSEGLAPAVIQRILEVCKHLFKSGITLLLVEQNIEMAEDLADQVCIISRGQVVYEAPREKFVAERELQNQYLWGKYESKNRF